MRTCVLLYGLERGDEIKALIEAATQRQAPCERGRPCPLDTPLMPAMRVLPTTKALARVYPDPLRPVVDTA